MVRYKELQTHICLLDCGIPKEPYAYHPEENELPWQLLLSLGSFSKKHIFTPKKLVLSEVCDRLADFENRFKWAVKLQGKESSFEQRLCKSQNVPRYVCSCCGSCVPCSKEFGSFTGPSDASSW